MGKNLRGTRRARCTSFDSVFIVCLSSFSHPSFQLREKVNKFQIIASWFPPAMSALSRRPFTLTLTPPVASTPSSTALHSRHLKRIHIAAEILKATKICAGDIIVLRARGDEVLVEGVAGLEIGEVGLILREGECVVDFVVLRRALETGGKGNSPSESPGLHSLSPDQVSPHPKLTKNKGLMIILQFSNLNLTAAPRQFRLRDRRHHLHLHARQLGSRID